MTEQLPAHALLPVDSSGSTDLVAPLPASIARLGASASFAWGEFFGAMIGNAYTRAAYLRAVRRFLAWLDDRGVLLERVDPGTAGLYFRQHSGSIPTKKQHLAGLRAFLDTLVQRHVLFLNPMASVRLERYQSVEGKTPPISKVQARVLLESIDISRPVGRRDKAIIGTLIYTSVRAGAAAGLRLKDFSWDGTQYEFQFQEKGGKSRRIPVRHDLQLLLLDYLDSFHWQDQSRDTPFFRSIRGRTGELTARPIRNIDVCRMVKRRLRGAELPTHLSPHSFRVTTITDLLEQRTPLEDVQNLAGHADPRTTLLYDRRQRQVTRNLVERISV